MCLRVVDKVTEHPRKRIGYKVFNLSFGKLMPVYFRHIQGAMEQGGTYHSETSVITPCFSEAMYPAGFHIFLRKRDAVRWGKSHAEPHYGVTHKVHFSSILASGLNNFKNEKTVVARTITILERV